MRVERVTFGGREWRKTELDGGRVEIEPADATLPVLVEHEPGKKWTVCYFSGGDEAGARANTYAYPTERRAMVRAFVIAERYADANDVHFRD